MPITAVYNEDAEATNLLASSVGDDLRSQVAVTDVCYTFLGVIKLCVGISSSSIDISAEIVTPFRNISLGECHLTTSKPKCTLGIDIWIASASVTFSYDFSSHCLEVTGKACVAGKCAEGSHQFCF